MGTVEDELRLFVPAWLDTHGKNGLWRKEPFCACGSGALTQPIAGECGANTFGELMANCIPKGRLLPVAEYTIGTGAFGSYLTKIGYRVSSRNGCACHVDCLQHCTDGPRMDCELHMGEEI